MLYGTSDVEMSEMKPSKASTGSIHENYVALFRRLDENLKVGSGSFDAAPFVSLVFEQLARGARPNDLFDWQAETPGSELAPYYRVLLDSYLDHLVYAEVEPGDVQEVNQLLQDILDGVEPDKVLNFESTRQAPERDVPRPRQVVYVYKVLQEMAAQARVGSGGRAHDHHGRDPHEIALDRVARQCDLSPAVLGQAYADASIRAEAQKLLDRQAGLSEEMHGVAERECARQASLGEDELVREYAEAWRARNRDRR
jgi:hypothetical protein